jgi:fructose-specific component phosphotransferase system IIB-like protein
MISRNYKTNEIKPDITLGNLIFTAGDLLFDWTAFEIPNGSAELRDVSGYIMGTDTAAQNGELFNLVFAKSIDGAAPASLGTVNSAVSSVNSMLCRNNIIGYYSVDFGEQADAVLDSMVSYNVFGSNYSTSTNPNFQGLVLEGEAAGSTRTGFQTIYVAGIAEGGFNFGTGVLIAGAHLADDLTIAVDGNDADEVFAVGDVIYAANATNGTSATADMTITAVAEELITVSSAPAITNDFEVVPKNPLSLRLGLSY